MKGGCYIAVGETPSSAPVIKTAVATLGAIVIGLAVWDHLDDRDRRRRRYR